MQNSFHLKLVVLLVIGCLKCSCKLTLPEKDKYMACNELVTYKLQQDKEIIDSYLKQEASLKSGIEHIMYLDMVLKCLDNINEDTIKLLFVDFEKVGDVKTMESSVFDIFKTDYETYGKMHEFFFGPKQGPLIKILGGLKKEFEKKEAKKKAKENPKEEMYVTMDNLEEPAENDL